METNYEYFFKVSYFIPRYNENSAGCKNVITLAEENEFLARILQESSKNVFIAR